MLLYSKSVPSILVHLDDVTYKRLDEIVSSTKRQRAEFLRSAVKEAILKHEYARIREGYTKKPDSGADADHWSTCEEFNP